MCSGRIDPQFILDAFAKPPALFTTVQADSGKAKFKEHCAMCHEGGVPRAPHSVQFQFMGPQAIYDALKARPNLDLMLCGHTHGGQAWHGGF